MLESITIKGARVHNLKNISLEIPRNKLTVITGVSGSGKSSLAFDTLYAEGQRRYVESLSAYARQFLERMDRPDVDEIRGISPAIAIEQKNPVKTSRSTVGTATEIHDYLRLLFSRIGVTICPDCQLPVKKENPNDIVEALRELPAGSQLLILIPLEDQPDSPLGMQLLSFRELGYYRIWHQGELLSIDELSKIGISETKQLFLFIDRFQIDTVSQKRIYEAIEQALKYGHGRLVVQVANTTRSIQFSEHFECSNCHRLFPEPRPILFSFNNPYGACPECKGFGDIISLDLDKVIPDKSKSLNDGAIVPWNTEGNREIRYQLIDFALSHEIDVELPFDQLSAQHQQWIIDGHQDFPGIRGFFKWLEKKKYKIGVRVMLARYRRYLTCPTCGGSRLKREARNVTISNHSIDHIFQMSIAGACEFFEKLRLSEYQTQIADTILTEIRARLGYLNDVGLGYLTLNRRTQTLSGGEMKRINLATALGSKLSGTLFILDEPTIGLHPHDTFRLIQILRSLRDFGNTVVVLEHDRDVMEIADHIIDLGPAAGIHGGNIVFQGSYRQILDVDNSLTGRYLSGKKVMALRESNSCDKRKTLTISGVCEHNLKNINVTIPLNQMTIITGVSGSGKSTLVTDVLFPALKNALSGGTEQEGHYQQLSGTQWLDDVILMDQSPIGRTPRSNPVTYLKIFDNIRHLMANTQRAIALGLKPGAFSFNVAGGRCPKCEGAGYIKVEMQFLADVYLECDQCRGKRYQPKILDIYFHRKNIADILEMTVSQALNFFDKQPKIKKQLQLLKDVGLGYLHLGQSATTLSGGEAQRVKLAKHLKVRKGKHTLFIFDEPTTGLHFDDIATLMDCFDRLINAGNSVLIIEHNLDVIRNADYIIDLGPGGGTNGGNVVATGTPEEIQASTKSVTGHFLRNYLIQK